MSEVPAVEIRHGLSERHRRRAAELCYDAFRAKFEPILGPPQHGIAILEGDLDPQLIIAALVHEQLGGMAGLEYGGRYFYTPRLSTFSRHFGWLVGPLRWLLFLPFARHTRAGDLTVGALAVDPALRGQGIGTRLLETLFDWAREGGFSSVSLEVVDTNPGARRLYERLGFAVRGTRYCPFLCRPLGFSAVTLMIKEM
jgi:GNAT superfamily N-acetyltransferase